MRLDTLNSDTLSRCQPRRTYSSTSSRTTCRTTSTASNSDNPWTYHSWRRLPESPLSLTRYITCRLKRTLFYAIIVFLYAFVQFLYYCSMKINVFCLLTVNRGQQIKYVLLIHIHHIHVPILISYPLGSTVGGGWNMENNGTLYYTDTYIHTYAPSSRRLKRWIPDNKHMIYTRGSNS